MKFEDVPNNAYFYIVGELMTYKKTKEGITEHLGVLNLGLTESKGFDSRVLALRKATPEAEQVKQAAILITPQELKKGVITSIRPAYDQNGNAVTYKE